MSVKRKTADFLCAFLAFSIVLVSMALLAGESFFEGSVVLSGESLVLFGTEFTLDRELLSVLERLLRFNDVIFGDGFSDMLMRAGTFLAELVRDGALIAYSAARWAVGLG